MTPRFPHARVPPVLLSVALLAAAAEGAAAQAGSFRAAASAGLVFPTRDLGKSLDPVSLAQVRVELEPAPGVGATLGYGLTDSGISVELLALFTLAATGAEPTQCALLTGAGCRRVEGDASQLRTGARVTLHPGGTAGGEGGYFALGGGFTHYRFDDLDCDAEDLVCRIADQFTDDQTRPYLSVAVGIRRGVGPLMVEGEVADLISSFEGAGPRASGESQNDLLATVSVALPLGGR